MRTLVTGAAGFVGRHLVRRLENAGFDVVATDRELDVTEWPAVEATVARVAPQAIVHLAAQSSPAASWREPALTYRTNYLGTRCVLEAARRHAPAARVLLACSAAVYGSQTPGAPAFCETSPLRPASPYARTKAAADLLAAAYAARGLAALRARPFNHSGPGQSDAFVLSAFARQLAEIEADRREPVLRVGNLDSVGDFLDVEDVVEAYVALLGRAAPGVYNVASGRGVRIGDLLEGLLRLSRVRPRVEVDPERLRPRSCAVGDARRLHGATGWSPRVPLESTLQRVLEHWRRQVSDS